MIYMLEIKLLSYEFDDSIDDLFIYFGKKPVGKTNYREIDIPEGMGTMVREKRDSLNNTIYVDIVNPQIFLEEPYFDDFEVSGVNLKTEILNHYKNLNQ